MYKMRHTRMHSTVRYWYSTSEQFKQLYESLLTEQCGQTKPLMFSMMPRIRTPVFLQKVISRLTSPVDTACRQHNTRKTNVHWLSYILQRFQVRVQCTVQ